jgi:8-oxo-dGTP pyrophosphatase MutT (NUDIX family)
MSDRAPVQPVEAATVILVREPSDPSQRWECFMVRRHVRSDFAADVFVFPGGKVDPADRDPGLLEVLATDQGVENDDAGGPARLRLRVAALRELFEEAGVILAREMALGTRNS